MVREVLLRMQGPAGETPFVFTYREGKKIGDIKTALRGTLRPPVEHNLCTIGRSAHRNHSMIRELKS